jgi:DHA2 family multidrug resistance protein-like MFS transporter
LFALNLPLGALVLLGTRALPHIAGTARKLDGVSMALNAAAFAGLVVGAELMPQEPVLACFVLAAAASAMFALLRRERPRQFPMIPLDLLRKSSFRISVIASVCCFVGQSAAMVSLPFYLQHVLAQDVLRTGLLITPWPLIVALVAPVAGRLADRISGAWLCALGGVLLAIGLALAALWPLQGRPFVLVPFVVLCGVGFGLFQVSNNRNMFLSVPRARSGAAGGVQSTARLTGQAIGAVSMTLLFTMTPLDLAPRIGLGVASVLTLVAGLVSTLRAPANALR